MASAAAVDAILSKIEAALESVEKNQNSNVRLVRAETNLLTALEAFRDMTKAALASTKPEDRQKLADIYGGACERIARAEAMLKSVKLSEKNKGDSRLTSAMGNVAAIKVVLRERGLKDALAAAESEVGAWRPDAVPAPVAAPAPQPAAVPKPAPAPAAAPAAAPKAAGGYGADKTVITKEAEQLADDDEDEDRNIVCECAVELDPMIFWEADGTIAVEFGPTTVATIATSIKPPLPGSDNLNMEFPVPYSSGEDSVKMVFDPAAKTPAGGKFSAKAKKKFHIFDVPDTMGIQNSYKKVSPFGSKQLKVGKAVTEIHYQIKIVAANFEAEEIEDFNKVFLELTFEVICCISGEKSKCFSPDGKELDKPTY